MVENISKKTEETMLKLIALIVVALIAAVLIYASTKPDTFRVERSASIKAPPEKIFAILNDLQQWKGWSTWEKMDPAMKKTFGGPASGTGASYEWQGNNKVGHGRMEIIESVPPSRLVIKLDFIKPMEAHNTAEFTLLPKGEYTEVNWAMHGPSPFVSKLFQVFVSMDKMVGKDFEDSLAGLKTVAER
jgi:uncharacterized protein YndB with AHSA1/START domain